MSKQQLRAQFREMDRNRPADEVQSASRAIYEKLVAMEIFQKAQCVAAFLSLPGEVQTDDIIHACWEQGSTVCVPYYILEKKFYGMSLLDPAGPIKTHRYNVREPENPKPIDMSQIDLILIPAMAFDVHGVRLGHGGGHYDRLLLNIKGYRLGLAFQEQIVDSLPGEPHDENVNAILTEQKLIEVI
jgi:5-formyltetrahydrofolate cyclo-ligase